MASFSSSGAAAVRRRLLRVRDVAALVGVSVRTVWQMCHTCPAFPRPTRVSARVTVWDEAEVAAYVDRQFLARR